jgi:hypothetical protein
MAVTSPGFQLPNLAVDLVAPPPQVRQARAAVSLGALDDLAQEVEDREQP